jgi:hypothetical protein
VEQFGPDSWEEVSHRVPGRNARQCRDRYNNYLLGTLVANPWTPEEDLIICQKFREIGPHWVQIAMLLNGRSGNHVKNRWHKHLSKREKSSLTAQKVADLEKPGINLCEAIGVTDCDLAALSIMFGAQFPFTCGSNGAFSQGDDLL